MIDPLASLLGEWSYTLNVYSVMFRLFISISLAALTGCERSSKRHSAGIRTFIIVSLSTTITMLLDEFIVQSGGVKVYLLSTASIISISTISIRSLLVSSRGQIKGLTTSIALVTVGVLGLTSGLGFYVATLIGYLVLLCSLSVFPMAEMYLKNRSNHFEIHLELKDKKYMENFVNTIRKLGLCIDDIEANHAYDGTNLSVYTISLSIYSKELKKYKTHKEIIEALKSLDYIGFIEELSL